MNSRQTITQMKKFSAALCIFILLGYLNTAVSAPQQKKDNLPEVSINETQTGQLLFKQTGNQKFLQAPQLNTTITMDIQGIVANNHVQQTFTNTTNEWQHATYVFPLPPNAAVNQLTINVGERRINGVIQEKQQAKRTFKQAQQHGKKAALVEQLRSNLFTSHIANIPPNETIEISLTYFQPVKIDNEKFSIHFPMTITPRYTPAGENFNPLPNMQFANTPAENTAKIDLTVSLNAGATLESIQSLNHPLLIKQTTPGVFSMALKTQPLDQDFELTWRYKQSNTPQIINFEETYQNNDYGLFMLMPGLNKPGTLPKRDLIFVLDKSGSMAGSSIEQAKLAFKHALDSLRPSDTFQLITFDNTAARFFENSVAATPFNKNTAWQYAANIHANGGTNIQSAMALAFNNKVRINTLHPQNRQENNEDNNTLAQIVFLTDGAVGNEAEIFKSIANNIHNKRLFTVGLGAAPNRYFMNKAAQIGRGSYQIIQNKNTLAAEMNKLFTKLRSPVLTNISITTKPTDNTFTVSPSPIPDVYAGSPIFISYKKVANQQNRGEHTKALITAHYQNKPWQLPLTLKTSTQGVKSNTFTSNIPAIATLWARRNIDAWYDKLMLQGDSQAQEKITQLGLAFNLVTPFTSLVAVEEKVSRLVHEKAQHKQLKNSLPTRQQLPSTSLNLWWQAYLAFCVLCIALFIHLIPRLRQGNKQHA